MQSKTMLVVSNPPHGYVQEEAAASLLGLPVELARLKFAYVAPEVLAATDAAKAADIALSLKAAGLSVEVREGVGLRRIPWPTIVSSFDVGDGAFRADVGRGQIVELSYDEPAFGVFCDPPPDFHPPSDWIGPNPPGTSVSGPAAADALEWVAHLDLFYERDGRLRRIAIDGESMVAMVAECRSRFERLELDTRLEGVRPRRRFVAGEAGFDPDKRKRYAFGTLLLRHLLEEIEPELKDLTQYELGSRLAYLLHRQGSI